jgi:uncharacterized Zn-finger protein
MMQSMVQKYSSINKEIVIKEPDLPLSCPRSTQNGLRDAHPLIYLPIKEKKTVTCPYCGSRYVFVTE